MTQTRIDADVIVVGGGLAGLACALGLAGSDLSVTLLERADRLGGRAASLRDAATGDTVDVGPHAVRNRDADLLAFAHWVGTDGAIVWHDGPLPTVAEGERAIDIRCAGLVPPLHLAPGLLAVPQLSLGDKLSSVLASGDLAAFVPSPVVCCYLWFDRKVTACRYWVRSAASRPFNYDWYDLSNIRPGADGGSLIATNAIYAPRLGTVDDDAVVAATVAELAAFAPAARSARLRHARVPAVDPVRAAGTRTAASGHAQPGAAALLRRRLDRHRPAVLDGQRGRSGLLAAEAVRYDAACPQSLAQAVPGLHGLTGVLHRAPPALNSVLGM